jgi:hypothetical protein
VASAFRPSSGDKRTKPRYGRFRTVEVVSDMQRGYVPYRRVSRANVDVARGVVIAGASIAFCSPVGVVRTGVTSGRRMSLDSQFGSILFAAIVPGISLGGMTLPAAS